MNSELIIGLLLVVFILPIILPVIIPIILLAIPVMLLIGFVFFYVKGAEGIKKLPIKESIRNWLYNKISQLPETNPLIYGFFLFLKKSAIFFLIYLILCVVTNNTPIFQIVLASGPIVILAFFCKNILGWLAKKQPINETQLEVETDSSIVNESQKQQTNETLLNQKLLEMQTSSPIIEESLKQKTNQSIKSNGLLWKIVFLVIFEVIAVCIITFLITGFYSVMYDNVIGSLQKSDNIMHWYKLDSNDIFIYLVRLFFINILTSLLALCLLFVHKKYTKPCLISLNFIRKKEIIDTNLTGKVIYQFHLGMYAFFFMASISIVMVKVIQSNNLSIIVSFVDVFLLINFILFLVISIRHIQLSTGDYCRYLPKKFLIGILSSLILGTALTYIIFIFTSEGGQILGWLMILLIFPHTLILIVISVLIILKLAPTVLKILVKGFYFSIRDPKEYINDITEKHGFISKFGG